MLSRRGATVAELIVAMTLLGVIGAAAIGALNQQVRAHTRFASRLAAEAQMREALAPLLGDLGAASPAGGDFVAGEARDSTLELRTTLGEAYVCAVPMTPTRVVHALSLFSPRGRRVTAGDLLWMYASGHWHTASIERVEYPETPDPGCLDPRSAGERPLRIFLSADVAAAAGAPLRFTRRMRYSLYRAADGRTFLGLREWSPSSGRFSGLQPVAGPFDAARSRLRYFDSLGTELASGAASGPEIGAVAIELRAERALAAGPADTVHLPVMLVSVGLRNRR